MTHDNNEKGISPPSSRNELLMLLGQVAGLSASIALIFSSIYNFAFFKTLGLSFSKFQITINDHLSSTLLWVPYVIVLVFGNGLSAFIDKRKSTTKESTGEKRIEKVLMAFNENKSAPFPMKIIVLTLTAVTLFLTMVFVGDLIPWILRVILMGASLIILWLPFAWWLLMHPNILFLKSFDRFTDLVLYTPLVIGALCMYGYIDAKLATLQPTSTWTIKLKSQNNPVRGSVIRSLEKVVFLNYSNNRIIIINQEDISYAETSPAINHRDIRKMLNEVTPQELFIRLWNLLKEK